MRFAAYKMDVEKDGQKEEFAMHANGKVLESPKWATAASEQTGPDGRRSLNVRPRQYTQPGLSGPTGATLSGAIRPPDGQHASVNSFLGH
jgi:hypothetical protein